MTRTIVIVAALLAFSAGAEAQIPRVVKVLEKSYELTFNNVVFPQSPAGTVNVKPCATCPRVTHAVSANTEYRFNGQQLSFDDFQKMLDDRRKTSQPTYAVVHYSVDTNLVTRIVVKTD